MRPLLDHFSLCSGTNMAIRKYYFCSLFLKKIFFLFIQRSQVFRISYRGGGHFKVLKKGKKVEFDFPIFRALCICITIYANN